MSKPVIVAVDNSKQSMSAVDWAAEEASRHRRQLVIVHVLVYPMVDLPDVPADYGRRAARELRPRALDLVAAAEKRARAVAPELAVYSEVREGYSAAATLSRRSKEASLMVLGRRGTGRFAELLVGSTAVQVTAHAACPVVVVRDVEPQDAKHAGQIVAAVDGSSLSQPVLEFAFAEASTHDTGLVAIHVWDDVWPTAYPEYAIVPGPREAPRVLSEALEGWREKFPEVPVTAETVYGPINGSLVEYSAGARLLVVGSHGRGRFVGMLLGSTSQAMLNYAKAPVAVVRPPRH